MNPEAVPVRYLDGMFGASQRMLPLAFTNSLTGWQWLIIAAIPPLIVALYFLKLKRHPLEVPSTYLWRRTVEDLHVNSLWQRLRQSILLFLQLLLIALVILALLRPSWQSRKLLGDRFIFLVDASASMSATDVEPSRLEAAKTQIRDLIEQMNSSDVAMIVSFSDQPRIEQGFTSNRRQLRQALGRIQATNRTSQLDEALRSVAGLANPADSRERQSDVISVADALPATLYILSDGNVPIPEFSLGNLEPIYMQIGADDCQNVGIIAFNAQRNSENPDQLQVFARLAHFTREKTGDKEAEEITVNVDVYLNRALIDSRRIRLPKGGQRGMDFMITDAETGSLKMEIQVEDDLVLDNVAYATVNAPRPSKVLLVTPGNDPLKLVLETKQAKEWADIHIESPDWLQDPKYAQQASDAVYDLIVYDQCTPNDMPQANTLFIGVIPPLESWKAGDKQGVPQIIDTDRAHPLMQYLEFGNVNIAEARPLEPPPGATILIDSDLAWDQTEHGAIFAIAPRSGFEDAVLGFEIVDVAAGVVNTDWHIRVSFPLFINNLIRYLGGGENFQTQSTIRPGQPIVLRSDNPSKTVDVLTPAGKPIEVARGSLGHFTFADTESIGVYMVRNTKSQKTDKWFAVNLFDSRESDIRPQKQLPIGNEIVQGQIIWEPTHHEAWKYILIGVLVVLVVEWYIFNRRVYL